MVVLHSIFITTGTIRLAQPRDELSILGRAPMFKSLTLLIRNHNLMLLIFTDHPMPLRATYTEFSRLLYTKIIYFKYKRDYCCL